MARFKSKFGYFRKNFTLAYSVKRHICDAQSSRLRNNLHISVNDRVISLFREGFIFTKLRIRNFAKIKPREKFPN